MFQGTTGAAKAASLIHHGFINNCYIVNELMVRTEDQPCILNPLPLFHVFGLMSATFPLISAYRVRFCVILLEEGRVGGTHYRNRRLTISHTEEFGFSLQTIFPAIGYDQIAVMKCIQEYKCSRMTGSPTMYIDLMNHPERPKYDLSSLTYCTMGGAICTSEMRNMVEENFGAIALTGLVQVFRVSSLVFIMSFMSAGVVSRSLESQAL